MVPYGSLIPLFVGSLIMEAEKQTDSSSKRNNEIVTHEEIFPAGIMGTPEFQHTRPPYSAGPPYDARPPYDAGPPYSAGPPKH